MIGGTEICPPVFTGSCELLTALKGHEPFYVTTWGD
jgi:hypothetical protein